MTYRKSHTRFQLVSKSTTLDDLEGPLRTVPITRASFRAHHENLNEERLYCQWWRCSTMTLDSDNVRFMRIFMGVPWKEGVIQQWGNQKCVFSGFRMLRIRHLRKWGQHYYIQGGPKKTGPFLNVDNFAMVSGRKACDMSKVYKFCLEKKYKTCIAVCLNILCLICINIHYPWNHTEFDNSAYFNEFSLNTQWNTNDRLHTWLVHTKFNMGTLQPLTLISLLAADRSLH